MGARVLNDVTGEAVLADKEGREYHVIFDLQAVMALEKLSGRSAFDIVNEGPTISDCVCMILAGAAGYSRRDSGAHRVNGNLAQRIFQDSGGFLAVAPTLAESLSCAEALGLQSSTDGEDAASPLELPSS